MNMSEFNGYIYVNNIAYYGPRYICECKRLEKVRYECIKNGCLVHWPPSPIAQFALFTTTIGRMTHWPPSTFAKFSLFVTDQSESAQLVIRFVGRFMSSLLHDL